MMHSSFPGPVHHQWLGLMAIAAILAGMFLSEALMSIGMMALVGNAVLNRDLKSLWRRFRRHKVLLGLSGIFLIYLLSGLYSSDTAFWLRRLRITLPFLVLPFSILSIPRFGRSIYFSLLYLLLVSIALMCFYSLFLYLQDFERITGLYRRGQVMPTPIMHIRFSLIVAYCVAVGWYLFIERFYWRFPWERWLFFVLAVFLIIYLHVLAVRSGLLAVYGVLFFLLVREMVKRRKYGPGLGAVFGLILLGILAFRHVPTLRNKVGYTRYSVNLFLKRENLAELSDSYRLGSILAGLELSRRHPWTGVGVGDIRNECDAYYREYLPALAGQNLMPHNQYIFILASTGIGGLLYFIWATLYPLYYRRSYRNPLIAAFFIIAILSFLVEHTLETQLGLAFYLIFLLLGLRFVDEAETKEPI